MELNIDGKSQNVDVTPFTNFKQFYEKLSEGVSNEKRVISEIAINNELMVDGAQFDHFDLPMSKFNSVTIKTILRDRLVEENIAGLKDHIGNIISNIDKSADAFRMDDEFNSNNYFAAVIEGMRWFHYSVNLLISFKNIEITTYPFMGSTIDSQLKEIDSIFSSLEEVQAKKDSIGISDLLEYELKEILIKWQDNLDEFNN